MTAKINAINAHTLKNWIHDGNELALLDIREHGQYGENHLFFAIPLPYSLLELKAPYLMPRLDVRIAIYGDAVSPHIVEQTAQVLVRLGYQNIHYLEGGIEAWSQAGYGTFAGVNLPSKTFGEIAEHVYKTPSITALELHALQQNPNQKLVILDGRPVAEYQKMNIPGAICCPNGELALRFDDLVPDDDTLVVINCAGRTRSIIGAQTLINLGVPNPVYALENGTQGWFLDDLKLEHGSEHYCPTSVSIAPEVVAARLKRVQQLTERYELNTISKDEVLQYLDTGSRSVFICDVRTASEFSQEQWPALVQHAPGGQLIQATDQYVGVRGGLIVLCDMDGVRAPVVASWLKLLGWEVCLLSGSEAKELTANLSRELYQLHTKNELAVAHKNQCIHPQDLALFLERNPQAQLLDARPSMDYRQSSLQGASWTIRPVLTEQMQKLSKDQPILLFAESYDVLAPLSQDLARHGYSNVYLCVVDNAALQKTGRIQTNNEALLPDDQCIDYLFFVHDRHDGNKAAARQYLEWETNLIAQLDDKERNTFLL